MLLSSVQPPILSLFSSTGSNPLELFHTNVDESLPADSFVQLLQDDLNGPIPDAKSLLKLPAVTEDEKQDEAPGLGYQLCQTVLHIQSPTVRTTFVHVPSLSGQDLAIKHPWVHLQVRNLGRPWSFEIGIVDSSGRRGIIRASTFQIRGYRHAVNGIDDEFQVVQLEAAYSCSYLNVHLPTLMEDKNLARNGKLRTRDAEANIGEFGDVDRQPSPSSYSRLSNLSQRPASTNSRVTNDRRSKKGQHADILEEMVDPRMSTENEKFGKLNESHPLGSTEQVDHTLPTDKNPWTKINLLTKKYDMNMCNAYRDEIQNVLIFAGLFSGVTTAFCVESYTFLSEDPTDTTIALLSKISDQLAVAGQNISLPNGPPPFEVTPSSVRINILWFTSLCLSLIVVLLGTLCLQWLREYQRYHSMNSREIFAVRNMRFEGLKAWKIPYFVGILPVLLQSAVLLFFAGIVELLWQLNHKVALVITIVIGFAVVLLAITTLAPAIQFILDRRRGDTYLSYSQCPYKSPQSWIAIRMIRRGKKLFKRIREYALGITRVKVVDVTQASGSVWFKHDIRWIRKRRTTSENLHFDIISGLDWVIKSFRENSEALQAVYQCFRDYSVAYNAPKVCSHITRGFFPDVSGTDLQVSSPHGDGQEKTNHIILDVTSAYLLRYLSKLNVSFNNASLPHRVELYIKLRSTYWHRLSSLGDIEKYISPSPYDLSHEIGADLPEDLKIRFMHFLQQHLLQYHQFESIPHPEQGTDVLAGVKLILLSFHDVVDNKPSNAAMLETLSSFLISSQQWLIASKGMDENTRETVSYIVLDNPYLFHRIYEKYSAANRPDRTSKVFKNALDTFLRVLVEFFERSGYPRSASSEARAFWLDFIYRYGSNSIPIHIMGDDSTSVQP